MPRTSSNRRTLTGLILVLLILASALVQWMLDQDERGVLELQEPLGATGGFQRGARLPPQAAAPAPKGSRSLRQEAVPISDGAQPQHAMAGLNPFDFGVIGKATPDPSRILYGNWGVGGTIRAVNLDGLVVSDELGSNGRFALYGLGPGSWIVEIDTYGSGHAAARVVLGEHAPVATLDLELVQPVALRVSVRVKSELEEVEALRLNHTRFFVAAHANEVRGSETTWASLDLIASASFRLNWNRETPGWQAEVIVPLPSDRPLNVSLFAEDLWLASQVKKETQRTLEWHLGPKQWPLELGRLEVHVMDARNGDPLDYAIETPHWESMRENSELPGTTIFPSVPPGWRVLLIGGGLHENREHHVFVKPGEQRVETIRLMPGVRIAGEVISSDGDPIQTYLGAWLVEEESGRLPSAPTRICWTGHHGSFFFNSLTPGTYMIRDLKPGEFGIKTGANFPDYGTGLVRVVAPVDQENLTLELEPLGTIVLELAQEPIEPLRWRFLDANDSLMRSGQMRSIAPVRIPLPPGTYRLETEGTGGVKRSRSFKLGSEEQRIAL